MKKHEFANLMCWYPPKKKKMPNQGAALLPGAWERDDRGQHLNGVLGKKHATSSIPQIAKALQLWLVVYLPNTRTMPTAAFRPLNAGFPNWLSFWKCSPCEPFSSIVKHYP